jgi:hypothetical protein
LGTVWEEGGGQLSLLMNDSAWMYWNIRVATI